MKLLWEHIQKQFSQHRLHLWRMRCFIAFNYDFKIQRSVSKSVVKKEETFDIETRIARSCDSLCCKECFLESQTIQLRKHFLTIDIVRKSFNSESNLHRQLTSLFFSVVMYYLVEFFVSVTIALSTEMNARVCRRVSLSCDIHNLSSFSWKWYRFTTTINFNMTRREMRKSRVWCKHLVFSSLRIQEWERKLSTSSWCDDLHIEIVFFEFVIDVECYSLAEIVRRWRKQRRESIVMRWHSRMRSWRFCDERSKSLWRMRCVIEVSSQRVSMINIRWLSLISS